MRCNWRTILFSDDPRFTIKFSDGRLRIWRLPGECFSDGSVMQVDQFGGVGKNSFPGKDNFGCGTAKHECTTLL